MDHSLHTRLDQADLNSAILEGATVYGADDHKVGTVSHVHGAGLGSQVIVDVGGFLGMGERQIAVQMPSISFVQDDATADDATAEQKAAFEAGHGGALVPAACVDRLPAELPSFAAFEVEAQSFCPDWVIVFSASLSGRNGQAPSSESAQTPLEQMVAAIKAGQIANFLAFDRQGDAIRLG